MSFILTITGMSGSGKTTLARELKKTGRFDEAVSVTTRAMRPGESHGIDYFFVSNSEFSRFIDNNLFVEHVSTHGNSYGVPRFELNRILESGKNVVIVVDPVGAARINDYGVESGVPVLSLFIDAEQEIITERFFKRIDSRAMEGMAIDLAKEAGRMQAILSQERFWKASFEWDVILTDLHVIGRLDQVVEEMTSARAPETRAKSLSLPTRYPKRIEENQLSGLINDVIEGRLDQAQFYGHALAKQLV